MKDIIVKTFSDFKDPEIKKPLQWLIKKTEEEYYMRQRDMKFYQDNMVFSVFIYLKTAKKPKILIGGACVVKCLTRNGKAMDMKGSVVVEMGSLYCDPSYRSKPRPELKISRILTLKRLEFVFKKNLIPVVVTGSPAVLEILPKIGATPMKGNLAYGSIYTEIRICECFEMGLDVAEKKCGSCPLKGDKGIWFFPDLATTIRILKNILGKDLMKRIV